jgi:filamentous hemagglutinin family protein
MTHPSAKHGAYRPWAVRTVVVRLSRKLTATYRLRSGRVLSQLLTALLAGFSTLATALPEGASLVAGQANISTPNANAMVVTQGSDKAILNWQSFNIGAGQSMQFVQPGAASVALNRVTGAAPSSIYGSLSANGQVFLINPAGVMFAPGAQVHVGGLVASTLALSNEDFMAGRYTFSSSGNAGAVTNGGNIRAARGGYVLLAAPNVSNTGSINADAGSVGLVGVACFGGHVRRGPGEFFGRCCSSQRSRRQQRRDHGAGRAGRCAGQRTGRCDGHRHQPVRRDTRHFRHRAQRRDCAERWKNRRRGRER